MTQEKDKQPYWAGEPYSDTLERVITALSSRESLVAVTGNAGMGKSAMALELIDTLQNNGDAIIYFATPPASNTELHQQCRQQHQELDRFAFMVALEKWLLQLNKDKKRCVLIVDEAHLLRAEVITTIRVMNNLQSATHRLLQVVLFGEPDLYKVLGHPQSGGLTQRISMRTELGAMDKTQIKQMMLDLYGVSLDPGATTLAYKLSQGKIGIAIAIGQALQKESDAAGVNRQQLRKAIVTVPKLASLLNRHRLKLVMPVAAIGLLGLIVWQLPSDLLDSPQPIKPGQTDTSKDSKAVTNAPKSESIVQSDNTAPSLAQDKATEKTIAETPQEQTVKLPADAQQTQTAENDDAITADDNPSIDGNNEQDNPAPSAIDEEIADNGSVAIENIDGDTQDSEVQLSQPEAVQAEMAQTEDPLDELSKLQPQSDVTEPAGNNSDQLTTQTQDSLQQSDIEQTLYSTLQYWAEVWQSKNVGEYLDAYTTTFRPTNGSSHEQWRERRIKHISNTPWMKVSVGEMTIIHHQDNELVLRVWLNYASPGYQDQTLKELNLVLQDERWLIDKERNKIVKRGDTVFSSDEQ